MRCFSAISLTRCSVVFAVVCLMMTCQQSIVMGQGGGGGGAGGGGTVPVVPQQPVVQQPAVDTPVTDNGTNNANNAASDGQLDTVEPARIELQIPDRRNQGFVGGSAETQQTNGFVGGNGVNAGIPLDGEARGTAGGTINNGRGQRAGSQPQPPERFGIEVPRQSMRARLVPSFASPRMPGFASTMRFQSRLSRQPVARQIGQSISVSIGNGTATLRGVARNEAERQILIRQLRLEPGVYKITDLTTR